MKFARVHALRKRTRALAAVFTAAAVILSLAGAASADGAGDGQITSLQGAITGNQRTLTESGRAGLRHGTLASDLSLRVPSLRMSDPSAGREARGAHELDGGARSPLVDSDAPLSLQRIILFRFSTR
ncbi:MAG: hypothetical protein V3U18_04670 [Alphaproteobacteria bacterium]|jgi:hypothetical protein